MIENGIGEPPPALAQQAATAVSELSQGQAMGVAHAVCLVG